ncbi:MAG: carboxymuconolactone decarboxylase family protein [Pseudomonadota bacterium]
MGIESLRDLIPDYAKDIRLNLGTLSSDETLSSQQKWGAFLASALASRNATVMKAVAEDAQANLSDEAVTGAKAAAAIMGMNNVYYRAIHLMEAKEYSTLPAKLRMNIIGNPGVDKVDFELWSLAVSAVNGCGMCLDAHEKVVKKGGLSTEQVQTALRIASVVHAAAAVMSAEEGLSS